MSTVRAAGRSPVTSVDVESLKRQAAEAAVAEIRSGMRVGLGTGSTARHVVEILGAKVASGQLSDLACVPTSVATRSQAGSLRLEVVELSKHGLDLAIDGADEVDPKLNMIKGLGGAFLEEKRVELAAARRVYVVDESKLVTKLGTRAPLPVEVPASHWRSEADWLRKLGAEVHVRGGETSPFVTDSGNFVLDCRFAGGIDDPESLAHELDARDNIRAHGLFLGMADRVIVSSPSGVKSLTPAELPSIANHSSRVGSPHTRNPALSARASRGEIRASTPVGPHSVRVRSVEIIPAVLVKSRAELEDRLGRVEGSVKRAQVDVMDSKFVANQTVIPEDLRGVRTQISLEFHLMVENPGEAIRTISRKNSTYLVHLESLEPAQRPVELARLRRDAEALDSKLGIAISPNTPLDELLPHLRDVDEVLVMTVEPGLGGQGLIPETLEKVRQLRTLAPDLRIEVDGGINLETARAAAEAGADMLVAGSAIYGEEDTRGAVDELLLAAKAR
ncbi:MAG: ribose-5-phosphate isomerase RpiA [Deltaproteobacteria bacterium]|nr:ribose-5-phosphate isomerase RpiA [Deltaproteobacteria bacterium]